jgi:DNA-binding HxlR family transcriptional regulator
MKTMAVLDAMSRLPGEFRINDLRRLCPAVSVDMVRRVLKDEQRRGALECLGRGPQARWRKLSEG